MKTPRRFQSQLLIRRSYQPDRAPRRKLGVAFESARPVVVLISKVRGDDPPDRASLTEVTLSG